MNSVTRPLLVCAVVLVLCCVAVISETRAQPQSVYHRISSAATYVREPTDRALNLRIVANIPSYASMYVLVHDANGKLIYNGRIAGEYSPENPLLIPIKPDSISGDYKIVFTGKSLLAIHRPITDLAYEVYGGNNFGIGQDKYFLYFQPPTGVAQMAIAGYRGDLKILNMDDSVLADTKASGKYITDPKDPLYKYFGRYDNTIEFPVEPGKTYKAYTAEVAYFKTREVFHFAFDPAKWFEPDAKLDAIKWWELID